MASERRIAFDKVKNLALRYVDKIRQHIEYEKYGSVGIETGMTGFLGTIKAYIGDGKIVRAREATKAFEDKITEFIRGLDVRNLGELLKLCPHGLVQGLLPGWLYGDIVAEIDEDGWYFYPKENICQK